MDEKKRKIKEYFVATVQILIPVEAGQVHADAMACDYVSDTMREAFPDWGYLTLGGQMLSPTPKLVTDPDSDEYEEGEFLA